MPKRRNLRAKERDELSLMSSLSTTVTGIGVSGGGVLKNQRLIGIIFPVCILSLAGMRFTDSLRIACNNIRHR